MICCLCFCSKACMQIRLETWCCYWLLFYLPVLGAAVSQCTNWIKSNFDVFRQLMTPVVQVDKAISWCIRNTAVDIERSNGWKLESTQTSCLVWVAWPSLHFNSSSEACTNKQSTCFKSQRAMKSVIYVENMKNEGKTISAVNHCMLSSFPHLDFKCNAKSSLLMPQFCADCFKAIMCVNASM